MRFFRFAFFAVFWMAIGLGLALFPINEKTVWERLWGPPAPKTSNPVAVADKETHSPLGNYTAQERANIDRLIQGNSKKP